MVPQKILLQPEKKIYVFLVLFLVVNNDFPDLNLLLPKTNFHNPSKLLAHLLKATDAENKCIYIKIYMYIKKK